MYLALIAILIAVNALFVMAEMALVSRARLKARADKGDRAAGIAVGLIDQPTSYLSTIQIVVTMIAIGLGMFGEAWVAADVERWLAGFPPLTPYRHQLAALLTAVLLTLVTLVFAELVPKRLGQMNPEGIARFMARPMDFAARVVRPLVAVLSAATNVIVRLVPIRPQMQEEAQEEVRAIIASGTEAGVFHGAEQELVDRVFRLSDQKVTAIMVPRTDIDYLRVDDSTERIRVAVATSTHSHFPVCGKGLDELFGVVHVKDLVKHGLISDSISLRELVRPPVFVPESTPAIGLLDQFRDTGVHIAFVVDEYGAMIGLVTLNDLLAELVGRVRTGGQDDDPEIVRRADGSYLLDGQLGLPELKKLMGIASLPQEEAGGYETLGGFVMTHLGRVPSTGDTFIFDRFQLEVVDMDRTRVDKVLLTIAPPAGSPPSPDEAPPAADR